jgi:hypothetical protein
MVRSDSYAFGLPTASFDYAVLKGDFGQKTRLGMHRGKD